MKTLAEIRALIAGSPVPQHAETAISVIGGWKVTVAVNSIGRVQHYVHMKIDGLSERNPIVALTRDEALDIAAALIYHAQEVK